MPSRTKPKWAIDLPSHDALEGLSKEQRLEVVARLNKHLNRHPAIRALSITVMVMSASAGVLLNKPIATWLQTFGLGRIPSRVIGAMSAATIVAVCVIVLGYWILWNLHARSYRSALREIGRDVCIECGYWLRGLTDDVLQCPECGAKRNVNSQGGGPL